LQFREIHTKRLVGGGVGYRLSVIAIQTLVFWAWTGRFKAALGASVGWNIINVLWYFAYHYLFARLVKIGRDSCESVS